MKKHNKTRSLFTAALLAGSLSAGTALADHHGNNKVGVWGDDQSVSDRKERLAGSAPHR